MLGSLRLRFDISWCSIDDEPSRFILGDSYGRLALLSLDNLEDLGLVLIPLGEVSNTQSSTSQLFKVPSSRHHHR